MRECGCGEGNYNMVVHMHAPYCTEGKKHTIVWHSKICRPLSTFHVRLAITSVWKVQFQHFQHFSVANNELFHTVCSTQNIFLLKMQES